MSAGDLAPVRRGIPLEGVRLELRNVEAAGEMPAMITAYLSVVIDERKPPEKFFLASLGLPLAHDQPHVLADFKNLCVGAMNAWIAALFDVEPSEVLTIELAPGAPIPSGGAV